MTQDSAGPCRKHRGHPASRLAHAPVADRVNAAPNRAQLTTPDPVLDCTAPHPEVQKLASRNEPVLTLREVTRTLVKRTRRTFSMSDMDNVRRVGHLANRRLPKRAWGALISANAQRKRGSSPPVPPLALIP